MTDLRPTLEFDDELSAKDIKRLISYPDNDLLVVWTAQHPGAIARLKSHGTLTGDPKFAFATDYATGNPKLGKKLGYAWIQSQMSKRMADCNDKLPIWVSLTRPTDWPKEDYGLLRVEVPKSRILFLLHFPWMELLQVMARLEESECWPEDWPLGEYPATPIIPYIAKNVEDARRNLYLRVCPGSRLDAA